MQGVELLIHLDGVSGPSKDGWEALKDLAGNASLVVTEEMPTSPYAQWTQVCSRSAIMLPLLCLDPA